MGAGIPDLSSRRTYGGPGLERIEGGSVPLETILAGLSLGASAYKWNDRNLLISPLQFDSGSGSVSVPASGNGPASAFVPLHLVTSRRGALLVAAMTMSLFAGDATGHLTILSGGVNWFLRNGDDGSSLTSALNWPSAALLSTIGSVLAPSSAQQVIPLAPPPIPLVIADGFIGQNNLPQPTHNVLQFAANATIFVTNNDAANPHTANLALQIWYRIIEGLEP